MSNIRITFSCQTFMSNFHVKLSCQTFMSNFHIKQIYSLAINRHPPPTMEHSARYHPFPFRFPFRFSVPFPIPLFRFLQFILLVIRMFDCQAPDVKIIADGGNDIILPSKLFSVSGLKPPTVITHSNLPQNFHRLQ